MCRRIRFAIQLAALAAGLAVLPAAASAAELSISANPDVVRSDQNYALTVSGSTEQKASVTVYEDSDLSRPCAATPLDEDDRASARLVFYQEARAGSFSYERDVRPGWYEIDVEDNTLYDEYVEPRASSSGTQRLCGYVLYTIGTNPPPDASDSAEIRFVSGRPEILRTPSSKTKSSSARFRFRSSDSASTFECRLDAGSFKPCSSPTTYRNLKPRKHTFRLRSVAAGGAVSANRTYSWRVVD